MADKRDTTHSEGERLRVEVASVLIDIRAEMSALQLWHSERPSARRMASDAPFCVDTLEFTEWVQFVFIERIQDLIDGGSPLPQSCDIAPMAEEYFRGAATTPYGLIDRLRRVDALLSGNSAPGSSQPRLSS